MKIKTIVLYCLTGLIVLALSYENGLANSKEQQIDSGIKVGVVSIRKIFEQSKKNADYKERVNTEQSRIVAELEKIRAELDAEKAGLKTLKTGSSEHLAQMKEILRKQADYQAQQEFHKQQLSLQERQWIEDFYKDILQISGDVAMQKGLDIVLENSEPEFTDVSAEGLIMTIRTHKLLYSDGCLDITDEVVARLDKDK